MRSLLAPALLIALVGSAFAADDPKLEPIFNGRDLTGWSSPGMQDFWRVTDGVLIGENDAKLAGNYLWSEKEYGDFILEFDVRWTGEIDSGIEFRTPRIQLQLGVSRSLKRDMTGSFYTGGTVRYPETGQAKDAARLLHPEGEWNTFRLEAKGPDFTLWINGQPASHYTDANFAGPGRLGLQIHAGLKMKVEYRNLRLAVPAPGPAAARPPLALPALGEDAARARGDGQLSAARQTIGPKGDVSRVPTGRDSSQVPLPALGEEVPLPRIREICEFYGLHDLWRKIERDPPARPFKSDGCTGWFDDWKGVSLYPAGFLHDLKYWAGYPGEDVERLAADAELMLDVARLLGSTEMAETMFHGVRVGGSEKFKTAFAWGFGRKPVE